MRGENPRVGFNCSWIYRINCRMGTDVVGIGVHFFAIPVSWRVCGGGIHLGKASASSTQARICSLIWINRR